MNFLFLSNCRHSTEPWRDASTRYRGYHLCEELVILGHVAHVAHIDTMPMARLSAYDLIVFIRPVKSQRFNELIGSCQRLGIRTVADYDDLNFSVEAAATSPAVESGFLSADDSRKRAANVAEALQFFDTITVATTALADEVRLIHHEAQVHVVPNGLSRYWLEANAAVHKPQQWAPGAIKRFGYMPGSRGHDHDFSLFTPLLKATLLHQPELHLDIVGALNIDESLSASKRVTHREAVAFNSLPNLIVDYHASLAPLANNRFNRCKSHIKFIESAAFGTPVIASPIPDMERHDPVNGLFLIRSGHDWAKAQSALSHPDDYQAMSETLKRYARTHCTAQHTAREWLSIANITVGEQSATFATINPNAQETAVYGTHNAALAR